MPIISTERLSGFIAGVFLLRATESLISTVSSFFLPTTDITIKLSGAVPALIGAVIASFMGYGYLCLSDRKKWFHVVAIVVFSLSGCVSVFSAIVPFFIRSSANVDSIRVSMFIGAIVRLFVASALITCVVIVMKRTARPALTEADATSPLTAN
jgi:hypothetical protein